MSKSKYIISFLIFISITSCVQSERQNDSSKEIHDISTADLMLKTAEEQSNENTKDEMIEYSNEEINILLKNPSLEDRDILISLFDEKISDPITFEPFEKGDIFIFEENFYKFFKRPDKIITNEFILYKESDSGEKELLHRFFNFEGVIGNPNRTNPQLYFYIENKNNVYKNYLWVANGKEGTITVLSEEAPLYNISWDSRYLAYEYSQDESGNYFGIGDVVIPNVRIYSIEEKSYVKEIKFFEIYTDAEPGWYTLEIIPDETSFHIKVFMDSSVMAEYKIFIPSFEVLRIQ